MINRVNIEDKHMDISQIYHMNTQSDRRTVENAVCIDHHYICRITYKKR
jgi:hypothetical protein